MDEEQRARYVRWQDYRTAQLSTAISLFLGFAAASLAFAITLGLDGKLPREALEPVVAWWGVSAALGCAATVSKLLDYRFTARKISDGGPANARIAKALGYVTWGCFWSQIATYVAGAYRFLHHLGYA